VTSKSSLDVADLTLAAMDLMCGVPPAAFSFVTSLEELQRQTSGAGCPKCVILDDVVDLERHPGFAYLRWNDEMDARAVPTSV
jgi:hypothetical protein